MPGQVWFYYNQYATKPNEKTHELGSCTSRPVVIIQHAFYPEWSDTITVVPLTHSDRRSGVYIDSTIFRDGTMIEGGTVLPYIFYNVKTKFLFPIITTANRRKLITLAPEDWEAVKNGFMYHLGLSDQVPAYVEQWKHLDDYDKKIIIQDVKLAVNDLEDAFQYNSTTLGKRSIIKGPRNPFLVQQPAPDPNHVENHLMAAHTELNRATRTIRPPVSEVSNESAAPIEKQVTYDKTLTFKGYSIPDFLETLSQMTGETLIGQLSMSQIDKTPDRLKDVELKKMPELLNSVERAQVLEMPNQDIVNKLGVGSTTTASRLRKMIREHYPLNEHDLDFLDMPEPLRYDAKSTIVRSRFRKNAYRRKVLFRFSKEELLKLVFMSKDAVHHHIPSLPLSAIHAFKIDICKLYPIETRNLKNVDGDDSEYEPVDVAQTNSMCGDISVENDSADTPQYELWETLCPQEINEVVASSRGKGFVTLGKNFGITKEKAKVLRGQVMSMRCSNPVRVQPDIPTDEKIWIEICKKIVKNDLKSLTNQDLLVYCRMNPNDIMRVYTACKVSNTPGKSDIRFMKKEIRTIIAKPV